MIKINIKPLSINEAFQGKRFKSPKYNKYIDNLMLLLPDIEWIPLRIQLNITIGYSNVNSDIDNALKPFIDCLQKRYGFNDRHIYKLVVEKTIVPKGIEFIEFELLELNK